MLIASKSFMAGLPLSVTRTVTGNVPLAVGVQLKAPVEPLIVAPDGAPASSENVSVFAGMSPSVAVAVKVTGVPTEPVLFPIGASTGAWFTSFTVIVIAAVPVIDGLPLSIAVMVTGYVPGPCASVGVQEKAPVPAPIVAPVAAGVPSVSDQVIVLAGTSESVAVTVKANAASSFVVLFPGFVTTGAEFTSFTVIENPAEPLNGGLPLSVAVTVTGYTPGPCASVGVQLKAPVDALMVAPVAGGVPSVSDQVCTSPAFGSVAVTVKVSAASSFVVLMPGFVTTGA